MRLDDVRGFVFDVDGTLVRRHPDGVQPMPGAVEVLERIRASGRRVAIFSNGSHLPPAAFAAQLRADGLPVADEEMVSPVSSALSYLRRRFDGRAVLLFAQPSVRDLLADAGVRVVDGDEAERADVVLVLHVDDAPMPEMERAARAILGGAKLLTANYLPAYAGANGPIFSRGAMITAAIAKASSTRPTVVGKPSRAAVQELRDHLGVPSEELLVTGDDVRMDIGLGRLGGAKTVLVRTGITGGTDLSRLPEHRRPHAVVDGVGELLQWL
jgi:HAD superfamily hydrolase (TIGR01450 family)